MQQAKLLLLLKQEHQALQILDQIDAFAPNELATDLLRAEAFASLGLFDHALAILDPLKKDSNGPELSDIYLTIALIHEYQEDYECMFYALHTALEEDPGNTEALRKMWYCMEVSKKYEESILLHLAVIDEAPYTDLAWYNLAHAYAYLGQYEEAVDAFEFAFVINPSFEFAYRDCAEICFETKRFEKALDYYKDVLDKFEADQDLYLRIGQCYQHLGQLSMAKYFLNTALQLDPLNDEVFFHLGECHALENKWEEAIAAYKAAIHIEDKREEYFSGLAEVYYQQGKWEKAQRAFEKATEIAPESTQYWIQYACFLMETGQHVQALEVLEEAELYAVGMELTYCRVACLFAMGHRQEALVQLSNALGEDFFMHDSLFSLLPHLELDQEVKAVIAAFQPF